MGRGGARWAVVTMAVVLGMMHVAPARAGWSATQTFTASDAALNFQPSLAVGADGTTAVAWRGRQSWVAVREPGSSWSPPVPVDRPDSDAVPATVVTPSGGVLVAWTRRGAPDEAGLVFTYRPPGKPFAAARSVVGDSWAKDLRLQIDDSGRVTAYYESRGYELKMLEWTEAAGWSEPETVLAPYTSSRPLHVFARTGAAAFLWQDDGVQYVTARAGAGLPFTQRRLTDLRRRAGWLLPASASPTGILSLRWTEEDALGGTLQRAAELHPNGDLTPSAPPPAGLDGMQAWSGGERQIVRGSRWMPGEDGEYVSQFVAERGSDGAWSPPVRAFDGHAEDDRVELDDSGRLHWVFRGADPRTGGPAVRAAVRGSDGTWSASRSLSSSDHLVGRPALAAAGDHAAVAWIRQDGAAYRTEVRTWTPGPDALPSPPAPLATPPAPLDHSAGFHADSARSGRLEDVGLRLPLAPAWSAAEGLMNARHVVAAELAYVSQRDTAADSWGVAALDVTTGRRRWTRPLETEDGFPGGYLINAGVVFVTTESRVWALDARTGEVRWRSAPLPSDAWWPTPPAVDGDTLLVHGSGRGSVVTALDVATGTRRWWSAMGGNGPVTVGKGLAMLASPAGYGEARTVADGRLEWSRYQGIMGGGRGLAAFDGAWLWSEGGLIQDASSGAAMGRFRSNGTPALRSPYAYVIDDEHRVVAYHQRTLERAWTWDPDVTLDVGPFVVDGVVYVASAADRVFGLDAGTGTLRWSAATRGNVLEGQFETLAAARGHLLVPVAGGLEAFRTSPRAPAPAEPGPSTSPELPAASAEEPEPSGVQAPSGTPAAPRHDAGASPPPAVVPPPGGASATRRARHCGALRVGGRRATAIRITGDSCATARVHVRRLVSGPRAARSWRCANWRRGSTRVTRCARRAVTIRFEVRRR